MKKRFLTLIFGLLLFISASNAATCTEAWNATENQLYQDYIYSMGNCGNDECITQAVNSLVYGGIVNDGLWAACCYIAPWNC